ncbi:filamentous hemagglutinin N-terminal domain-containing protein [Nostoc sp. CHAB 5844]|nr:filamentous hemagglutinin N-terminal domain-containing protein [Nostoc sp. CHAB 5844]
MTQSCYLSNLHLILALSSAIITTSANNVQAQNITIDGTLSPAQTLNGPTYTIPQSVGQTVGSNLFHSFGQFSLNGNEAAVFQSATNIRNIFSRVTGGSPSLINGLIFTQSANVNLFFINPSGIVFSSNARLNVGGATRGSFVATTADAFVWSNGSQFSATNPGGTNSLLTIVGDPSGFLFNSRPPQPIQIFGSQQRVFEGQSFLLLGGNVSLSNSNLFVNRAEEGGRIEIAGVAEAGTVGLATNGNILSFNFPENLALADVSLTNGSLLNTLAGNGGSVAINARNADITASGVLAGIASGFRNVNSQAGDITVNATGAVKIDQLSAIQNVVAPNAQGNAGNIRITTDSLTLDNGAQLIASTRGKGDAGSVIIDAQRILFDRTSVAGSTVEQGAEGHGGDIRIITDSLNVTRGAQINASTRGKGSAGSVIINAQQIRFDGTSSNGNFRSTAFSNVQLGAEGNGGDIRITTNLLALTNGAQLTAATGGKGNAGSVIIDAQQILVDRSSLVSAAELRAEGNAGNVRITTDSLTLTNIAAINVSTNGKGDAGSVIIDAKQVSFDGISGAISTVSREADGNGGDVRITTNSLIVSNGSGLSAATLGKGDAGSVIIDAQQVLFDGTSSDGIFNSSAFSAVEPGAEGNGGDIKITTNSLTVTNSAQLVALTRGKGNAGSVIIDAKQVLFDGLVTNGIFASTAFSTVEPGAVGNGGDIRITTDSLVLTNRAVLNAANRGGKGNAGSVIINGQQVLFDRSAAVSAIGAGAEGNGGDIRITTDSLILTNGSQLQASTAGQGNAGNVNITAFEAVSISGTNPISKFPSALFTSTSTRQGGDITVNTNLFRLSDSAVLDARTFNDGNSGNITVNANTVEVLNGGQLISTTSGRGSAGKITVNATERAIFNGIDANFNDRVARFGTVGNVDAASGLFVRSDGLGDAGDIEVNSPLVLLDNGARFIAESRSVNGGDISVNAGTALLLRRGSQISTTAGTAQAGGNGGNININAGFLIAVPDENSNITANAFSGTGGRVQINTQGIFGIAPRLNESINTSDITASSATGINGEIIINRPNVDPTQGLTELSANTVDTASLVDSGCAAFDDKTGSQFTVTGRGGLPASPDEAFSGDAVWSDTRLTVAAKPRNNSVSRVTVPQKSANVVSIVPATGWVFNNKGEVTLVSQVAKTDAYSVGSNHVACVKP